MEKLRKRYNMSGTVPYEVKMDLPCSGVKARIPCHDAWEMMMDLLTDPRIKDTDYLWFDDDPAGEPPEEWLELADINDGLAYRKAYDELIRPDPLTESGRRKVLLPVFCLL